MVVLISKIEVDFVFGSSKDDQRLLGQVVLEHFDVLLHGAGHYLVDEFEVQHIKEVVIEGQDEYHALRFLLLPADLLEHHCTGTTQKTHPLLPLRVGLDGR